MTQSEALNVGDVLRGLADCYRENAGPLLWSAALVFLPVTLASEIVAQESVSAGAAVSVAASGSMAFLYAGIVAPLADPIRAAADPTSLTLSKLWAEASKTSRTLILAGVIYTVLTTLGTLALIIPGLILATIWAAAPAAARFEGVSAKRSLGRSLELARGHGRRVFTVVLLVGLAVLLITFVVQALALAVAGENTGQFVGSWLGVVLAAPPLGLMPTVLYHRLSDLRDNEAIRAEEGEALEEETAGADPESNEEPATDQTLSGSDRQREES